MRLSDCYNQHNVGCTPKAVVHEENYTMEQGNTRYTYAKNQ